MLIGAPCLRMTVTTGAVVALLVGSAARATGGEADDLLERGWWNAARGNARRSADDVAAERIAAISRLEDDAARVAASRQAWLRETSRWQQRWSRPVTAARQPLVPVWAGPIVAWAGDQSVHAVDAANGRPAWRGEATPDTTLVHGGSIVRREGDRAGTVTSFGHLVFAGLKRQPAGMVLTCLDCSPSAQGRMAWATDVAADTAASDGGVAADGELCAIVCRPADERAPLTLVVCDSRDGRILWRRPCGTAIAADGRDHGRGRRTPFLHEGLVIVADHAGSVTAFTRAGQPAWVYRYEVSGRASDSARTGAASASMAAARDTLVVAARDQGGLLAIDDVGTALATPRLRWDHAQATRLVGTTPTRIVVEHGTPPRLCVLSVTDGSTAASTSDDRGAAGAILAGDVVIRAVSVAGADTAIEPLDVATLQPVSPAFPLGRREETAVALAIGPGALAVATSGMLSCITVAGPSP